MENLFKIINDGTSVETAPAVIQTPTIRIDNPTEAVYHKFGYWPKEEVEPERPVDEEGYIVYDDGYKYIDDGNGGKIIKRIYRKLAVVDPGEPEIGENQELIRDYWTEDEEKREHIYVVVDVIDIPPEIDEETQIVLGSDWSIDEEAHTKTKIYQVRNKIDNPPELEDGQQIISDRWEDDGENYTRIYEVRFVVDNPPELQEGEQVIDEHWDDDGVTRTHVYDRIMKVIDNEPELEEDQQIIDRWYDDDIETNTRTYHYEVRKVVDNPPELGENEFIFEDYWDDDGTTRTHVYVSHFRIDNPPELEEGQEIVEEHWEYDEETRTETHVYQVRKVVDEGEPELNENEFIHHEWWDDDGETRTHKYEVWTRVDQAPDADENHRVISTDEWTEDAEVRTLNRVYLVKEIINNKPEDDPDGDFWYVQDGEEETETQIIIKYKQIFKEWRVFSKLKLEYVAFQMGLLEKLDAFIDGIKLMNEKGQVESLRRFYEKANDIGEKHPLFRPYYKQALAALELTDEQGEALLQQIVATPTASV